MDKEYQRSADLFFSERHSVITAKFRRENEQSSNLLEIIGERKYRIELNLTDDIKTQLNSLFDLMNLYSNTESKYLYLQGIKDCISLSSLMDSELINADFNDIIYADSPLK